MSYKNTSLYNLSLSKRNVVISRNGEVNRVMQYLAGESIVYKNYYIEHETNLEKSSVISCNNKTLTLECNSIVFSGNISLRGENLSISGSLDINCNSIIGVSGISFCGDGFIDSTLDLTTNKVLTLQGVENSNIISKNRIYQDILLSPNYSNYVGNLELSKNSYPEISETYTSKAVSEWRTNNGILDNSWQSVCWSSELGIFVAVAWGGAERVMTSTDGINWTGRILPFQNDWRSICWSPELKLFVAVSNTSIGTRVMTSSDGINWVRRNTPKDNSWWSVCWSPQLGLFVSISQTESLDSVMTSPDGINWTLRNCPVNNAWQSVCWSPELGLFVAVSVTGDNNRVMTSPDGINWTSRTTPKNNEWRSISWSSKLRMFVVVSLTGSNDRVMTSSDGINWTLRNTPSNNEWTSVCWSSDLELFVAVCRDTSNNQIMTSSDGINWTLKNSPANINWREICWSSELAIFASVASSGTRNRVMTSSLKGRIPTSYNVFDSPFNNIDQNGNWIVQQTLKRGVYNNGDETPSVLGANLLYISNTSPNTPISNFTNPSANQEIVLVFFDSNTVIQSNANIRLRGGTNFTSTSNDTLTLLYTGTLWVEIGRSINP